VYAHNSILGKKQPNKPKKCHVLGDMTIVFKYIKSYCKALSLLFLLVPEDRKRNMGCQKDFGIIKETQGNTF